MLHDTPERRYAAAFTAGQMARASIRTARCNLLWAVSAYREGNTARFEALRREARAERRVFLALIDQAKNDPGFIEGYNDDGRTNPDDAARRATGDVIEAPFEDARQGRWDAVRGDMAARGAFAPYDPENRP